MPRPSAAPRPPAPAACSTQGLLPLSLCLGVTLGGCGALDPEQPPPPATSAQALEAQVRQLLTEENIPGAVVAITDRTRTTHLFTHGVARRDTGEPVTADTAFRAGSITKLLTAAAVLMQHRAGTLDVNAPLLPQLDAGLAQNPFESSHPLTAAHLLEHSDGMDDTRPNEFVTAPGTTLTLLQALAINPRSRTSRWAPGTGHAYGNPGYLLLGHLLEKKTGRRWEDVVTQDLMVPMGMRHATVEPTAQQWAALPKGYGGERLLKVFPTLPIVHRPAGNLVATAEDVAALVRTFLGRGAVEGRQVIPADVVDRMTQTRTLTRGALPVGLGAGLQRWEWDGVMLLGHGGNVDGFSASMALMPELDAGLITLTNANGAFAVTDGLQRRITRFLLAQRGDPRATLASANAPGVADAPSAAWTADQTSQVAGMYVSVCPRTVMLGFLDQLLGWRWLRTDAAGTLTETTLLQTPRPLVPAGPDTLRLWDARFAHLQVGADGRMSGGSRCWQRVPAALVWGHLAFVVADAGLLGLGAPWMALLALWRRRRWQGSVLPELLMAAACACAVMGLWASSTLRALYVFHPPLNPTTVVVAASPWVMLALVLGSLVGAARRGTGMAPVVVMGAAAVLGAAWLAVHGVLGFQAWSF